MKTLEVQNEIESLLQNESSLTEVVAALRQMRVNGVERDEAMQALITLRQQAPNEEAEDRILEVMDFVSGFCSPHMAVWD